MGSTLVIGLIPAFRFVLAVHVLVDFVFAGYIAMLVQARRTQIAERARARRIAERIRAEQEHAATEMVDVQHHQAL